MLLAAAAAVVNAVGRTVWTLASLAAGYSDIAGLTQTYAVEVVFRTDGSVDVLRDIAADLNDEEPAYVDPSSETANTWVRCTNQSGDDMTAGDTRGVWHQLNVERRFTMRYTSSGGSDFLIGTFDFELSSDASGVPIQAQSLGRSIQSGELF